MRRVPLAILVDILKEEITDIKRRKRDLHPVQHAEAQLALSIGLDALRRIERALNGGVQMKEYIPWPGESVDECAKRNGLRCLTRSERRAGKIEAIALIVVPPDETYEAVQVDPE